MYKWAIKHWPVSALLVTCVLSAGMTNGLAEQNGVHTDFGMGTRPCSDYVEANARNRELYLTWIGGYLSGYNRYADGIKNVLGQAKVSGAGDWLRSYCRLHPTSGISDALDDLIEALRTGRVPSQMLSPGRIGMFPDVLKSK